MEAVAEQELSVVLSSHLVADLERVCDYLIVLWARGCASPGRWTSCWPPTTCSPAAPGPGTLPDGWRSSPPANRRETRCGGRGPVMDPAWTVAQVGLEDLVLAYMSQAAGRRRRDSRHHLEVRK